MSTRDLVKLAEHAEVMADEHGRIKFVDGRNVEFYGHHADGQPTRMFANHSDARHGPLIQTQPGSTADERAAWAGIRDEIRAFLARDNDTPHTQHEALFKEMP